MCTSVHVGTVIVWKKYVTKAADYVILTRGVVKEVKKVSLQKYILHKKI